MQRIIKAAKAGNFSLADSKVSVDGTLLMEGEYELTMVADSDSTDSRVGITSAGFVLLDIVVTKELEQEGIARDAIRQIQQARKDAGLDVSDRISLSLTADQDTLEALEKHRELICAEVLALDWSIAAGEINGVSVGDSGVLRIELEKVAS